MASIPSERQAAAGNPREEEAKRGVALGDGAALLSAVPLVPHGGFWFDSELVRSIQLVRAQFTPRPGDVVLATFPKCGATWLKALAYAVAHRSRCGASSSDHPLLTTHPQDLVPFLETPYRQLRPLAADLDDAMPSPPRLLATHIPLSLLPAPVTAGGGDEGSPRIVYLCREPKDVLVSMWHFQNRVYDRLSVELGQLFRLFCAGVSVCGPVWDHYLEYWNASKARPGEVLFLRYEEMMADPAGEVRRLAAFLGAPFTDAEERGGVVDQVVRLCSFEHLASLEVNSSGSADRIGGFPMENSTYFRRGKVGDWKNHLSAEMAQQLDAIVQEKLKGSGLTF